MTKKVSNMLFKIKFLVAESLLVDVQGNDTFCDGRIQTREAQFVCVFM